MQPHTTRTLFGRRLLGFLVRQFGHPRGPAGRVAGWVMAHRGSNRRRNRWVVSLLDVRPAEHVLEVGFGPGLAIAELARRATRGRVHGIDHSAEMVRQARRRNAAAVREGRVDLRQASVACLPPSWRPLDAVVAVNSVGFWPDPARRLAELRELLRPGGRIALASQPRCPGADAATTERAGAELRDLLEREPWPRRCTPSPGAGSRWYASTAAGRSSVPALPRPAGRDQPARAPGAGRGTGHPPVARRRPTAGRRGGPDRERHDGR